MLYILFNLSQSFVVADKRDIQVSERKYSIAVSNVFFFQDFTMLSILCTPIPKEWNLAAFHFIAVSCVCREIFNVNNVTVHQCGMQQRE